MKKDLAVTLIAMTIGLPVILGIHIGKGIWAGMKETWHLQLEFWQMIGEELHE